MTQFHLDRFGISDVGKRRVRNEDQFLIAGLQKSMVLGPTSLSTEEQGRLLSSRRGHLFVVADGVGGVRGGERASRIAVHTVIRYVLNTIPWFFRLDESRPEELEQDLRGTLEACQRSIEKVAGREPAFEEMATTLTMAYILWPKVYVVHAGDSRCFLHRGRRLEQLTRDHTVAQQKIEEGARPEKVERWSHVLWNVVGGGDSEVLPEVSRAELRAGDALLLCTDGLTKHVSDEELKAHLALGLPAEETCRRMVAAANAAGGTDNVTVIVARFQLRSPEPI